MAVYPMRAMPYKHPSLVSEVGDGILLAINSDERIIAYG